MASQHPGDIRHEAVPVDAAAVQTPPEALAPVLAALDAVHAAVSARGVDSGVRAAAAALLEEHGLLLTRLCINDEGWSAAAALEALLRDAEGPQRRLDCVAAARERVGVAEARRLCALLHAAELRDATVDMRGFREEAAVVAAGATAALLQRLDVEKMLQDLPLVHSLKDAMSAVVSPALFAQFMGYTPTSSAAVRAALRSWAFPAGYPFQDTQLLEWLCWAVARGGLLALTPWRRSERVPDAFAVEPNMHSSYAAAATHPLLRVYAAFMVLCGVLYRAHGDAWRTMLLFGDPVAGTPPDVAAWTAAPQPPTDTALCFLLPWAGLLTPTWRQAEVEAATTRCPTVDAWSAPRAPPLLPEHPALWVLIKHAPGQLRAVRVPEAVCAVPMRVLVFWAAVCAREGLVLCLWEQLRVLVGTGAA